MACTITTTAGGASSNSYISIADATTYHETHISGADWTDATSDDHCRALQTATRLLDQWYDWHGSPVNATQALLWPRVGVTGTNGYELASDSIPTLIKNATAELARHLLAGDRTVDSDVEVEGVSSLTAGPVSLTFRSTSSKPIPDAVMAMVSPLGTLRTRTGPGTVTLRRG